MTTIASNWLCHRLGRFQIESPNLAVRLLTDGKITDFARQDIDVALRYGYGDWDGLVANYLFAADMTPICAPSLIERHGPLKPPEDIFPLPWLNNTHRGWYAWMKMRGIDERSCAPERRLDLEAQSCLGRAALAGGGS
ncbi:MAG: LysR substrate-binding domain-containing protein [Paracoccus sp. (in: a-proteobacteria)]